MTLSDTPRPKGQVPTTGGSMPRVFQTAPPQPASKARLTLIYLSVGGADASQKGLGLSTPPMLQ